MSHRTELLDRVWALPTAAAFLSAAHWSVVTLAQGRFDPLGAMGSGDLEGLYVVSAQVVGIFVAVCAAGLSLYVSASGVRVTWLRRRAGEAGLANWWQALVAMAVLVVMSLVAYVASSGGESWPRWGYQFCVLWALLATLKMMIFYRQVLSAELQDDHDLNRDHMQGVGYDREPSQPGTR